MRRGFTLVELLASAALSALLMLAVLQVIASVVRSRAALARESSAAPLPWRADLLDTLRFDLTNGRDVRFEPGRVTIVGHGSLDPGTLSPRHEPAEVAYA